MKTRLTRPFVLAALVLAFLSTAVAGVAEAANPLTCGAVSLKNRTFSTAYIVHSCNGQGQITYTVNCQPFSNAIYTKYITSPGQSVYLYVSCSGGQYLSSVSYSIK